MTICCGRVAFREIRELSRDPHFIIHQPTLQRAILLKCFMLQQAIVQKITALTLQIRQCEIPVGMPDGKTF